MERLTVAGTTEVLVDHGLPTPLLPPRDDRQRAAIVTPVDVARRHARDNAPEPRAAARSPEPASQGATMRKICHARVMIAAAVCAASGMVLTGAPSAQAAVPRPVLPVGDGWGCGEH